MGDRWAINNRPSPLPEAAKPVTTKFIGKWEQKFEADEGNSSELGRARLLPSQNGSE
jgi:hypothetical protein